MGGWQGIGKDTIKWDGNVWAETPIIDNHLATKKYVDDNAVSDHNLLNNLDYASANHTGFEPAKGADDNFVTDAEKIVIGNTSGTNTGDQVSGDFDHNSLVNTHNLTTNINHASITGAHNLTTDIDHDALTNFTATEHFTMLDEDNMATNSNTQAATQQSIKAYVDASGGSMPKNHIAGLITSNDTDTEHDINITAGEARDATDAVDITLASEITKRIDAGWAVGNDAGGIDTGAVAASTLYAVWLIKRSDTAVVDALFSLSFTAPTTPANYDYERLIGYVVTNSSSNIIAYKQVGDYFRVMGTLILDVNDTTITSTTWEVGALSVPPNTLAHILGMAQNPTVTATSSAIISVRANGAVDVCATASQDFGSIDTGSALPDKIVVSGFVLTDASSNIQYTTYEPNGDASVEIRTFGCNMLTRSQPQ